MKMLKKTVALLLVAVMLLLGCTSCSSSPTVMTIGSFEVSYDMLRYFAKNYMNGYADLTEEDFKNDPELQKQLEENIMASITELAAYHQLAKKFSLKLTSEDQSSVKQKLKDLRAAYNNDDDYEKDLENNFVTEDLLKQIYELELLCDKLYDYLTMYSEEIKWNVDIIDADFVESFFAAEYIMVYYSEEDKDEKKSFADYLRQMMLGGSFTMNEAYEDYKTEYGVKIDYQNYKAFTYTEMNEDFEKAVESLEIGEYSEVIDLGNAYQIIIRNALDMDYYYNNYNTVEAQWLAREFFYYVEDFAEDLEVTWKKKYKDIKVWEIE